MAFALKPGIRPEFVANISGFQIDPRREIRLIPTVGVNTIILLANGLEVLLSHLGVAFAGFLLVSP